MSVEDDLVARLALIQGAVGLSKVHLNSLPRQIIADSRGFVIAQPSPGLTDAQLEVIIRAVIENIAGMKDYVQKWLHSQGVEKKEMFDHIDTSEPLAICLDLWNSHKHPNAKSGYSRKYPRLVNIHRPLILTTKAEKGSSVVVQFTSRGLRQVAGSGAAELTVTADVVDEHDNKLGDIQHIATEAIRAWEDFLRSHGASL